MEVTTDGDFEYVTMSNVVYLGIDDNKSDKWGVYRRKGANMTSKNADPDNFVYAKRRHYWLATMKRFFCEVKTPNEILPNQGRGSHRNDESAGHSFRKLANHRIQPLLALSSPLR